jgi:hypothetical protein
MATFIYLGYSPWKVAGLKYRQLARQVGDLAEDLMANSTASILIKPTVAFNCAAPSSSAPGFAPQTALVLSSAASP